MLESTRYRLESWGNRKSRSLNAQKFNYVDERTNGNLFESSTNVDEESRTFVRLSRASAVGGSRHLERCLPWGGDQGKWAPGPPKLDADWTRFFPPGAPERRPGEGARVEPCMTRTWPEGMSECRQEREHFAGLRAMPEGAPERRRAMPGSYDLPAAWREEISRSRRS